MGTVNIVTVNFNTPDYIKALVHSCYRKLSNGFGRLTIINTGEPEDARELSEFFQPLGETVHVLHRPGMGHGLALHEGLVYAPSPEPTLILDSDVIILRDDLLANSMPCLGPNVIAVGQVYHDYPPLQYAHPCCLLLNTPLYFRQEIAPFIGSGQPASALYFSAQMAKMEVLDFPYLEGGYVLHRGRGSRSSPRDHPDSLQTYDDYVRRVSSLGREQFVQECAGSLAPMESGSPLR